MRRTPEHVLESRARFSGFLAALAVSIVLIAGLSSLWFTTHRSITVETARFPVEVTTSGRLVLWLGPGEYGLRVEPFDGVKVHNLTAMCIDTELGTPVYARPFQVGERILLECTVPKGLVVIAYNATVVPMETRLLRVEVSKSWW